jgi:hypothetical protein
MLLIAGKRPVWNMHNVIFFASVLVAIAVVLSGSGLGLFLVISIFSSRVAYGSATIFNNITIVIAILVVVAGSSSG